MCIVKYNSIIEEDTIGKGWNDETKKFSILFGMVTVNVHVNQRTEKADRFKHFVDINVFGIKCLSWIYVDEYSRNFYSGNKTYYSGVDRHNDVVEQES